MKKRLLITSIVMMLVVAVALSTATYAWFTSNATVTANSISMTAATSTAASIGISFTNSNYGTSITAVASGATFQPAAIGTITKYDNYADTLWTTANVYQSGSKNYFSDVTAGDSKITTVGQASALAYAWKDGTNTDFWINNGSTANEIQNVRISATVTGEATDFIRLAVFRNDGTNFKLWGVLAGDYTYVAAGTGTSVSEQVYYNANGEVVLTGDGSTAIPANSFTRSGSRSGETVAVGTAVKDRAVNAADSTAGSPVWGADYCIKQENAVYYIDLGGLDNATANATPVLNVDAMQIRVVVWMDGTALNDDTAGEGKISSIALNFSATPGTFTAETFGVQQP